MKKIVNGSGSALEVENFILNLIEFVETLLKIENNNNNSNNSNNSNNKNDFSKKEIKDVKSILSYLSGNTLNIFKSKVRLFAAFEKKTIKDLNNNNNYNNNYNNNVLKETKLKFNDLNKTILKIEKKLEKLEKLKNLNYDFNENADLKRIKNSISNLKKNLENFSENFDLNFKNNLKFISESFKSKLHLKLNQFHLSFNNLILINASLEEIFALFNL